MNVCDTIYGAAPCPSPADSYHLIDGPQNTWASLRVINATHDLSYTEFRPIGTLPARAATNWTEFYNFTADPWQRDNVVPNASAALHAALRAELWDIATCAREACP